MDSFYLYLLIYLVIGMMLWEVAPQTMSRFMPRDQRTHKYTWRFSTFLATTLFWPLALLQRR